MALRRNTHHPPSWGSTQQPGWITVIEGESRGSSLEGLRSKVRSPFSLFRKKIPRGDRKETHPLFLERAMEEQAALAEAREEERRMMETQAADAAAGAQKNTKYDRFPQKFHDDRGKWIVRGIARLQLHAFIRLPFMIRMTPPWWGIPPTGNNKNLNHLPMTRSIRGDGILAHVQELAG